MFAANIDEHGQFWFGLLINVRLNSCLHHPSLCPSDPYASSTCLLTSIVRKRVANAWKIFALGRDIMTDFHGLEETLSLSRENCYLDKVLLPIYATFGLLKYTKLFLGSEVHTYFRELAVSKFRSWSIIRKLKTLISFGWIRHGYRSFSFDTEDFDNWIADHTIKFVLRQNVNYLISISFAHFSWRFCFIVCLGFWVIVSDYRAFKIQSLVIFYQS